MPGEPLASLATDADSGCGDVSESVPTMTKIKHEATERLREAAVALSEEIWTGKWQHIVDLDS